MEGTRARRKFGHAGTRTRGHANIEGTRARRARHLTDSFTLLQQNGVVNPLFKTKPFVNSCPQGANRDFECHCNQKSINKRM